MFNIFYIDYLPELYFTQYYIPIEQSRFTGVCGLRIRIRVTKKKRIRPDSDPQYCLKLRLTVFFQLILFIIKSAIKSLLFPTGVDGRNSYNC